MSVSSRQKHREKREAENELGIAKRMRDGALGSPQRYGNTRLFNVRITGTGVSYRQGAQEFVYRTPEDFLTDEFVERSYGLPVVFEHPKNGALDTEEFRDRVVGTILLPYIRGDEVWGVAKIYDDDAADLMETDYRSTSPAVVFLPGESETISIDGKPVMIEGVPSFLDHLAICKQGVWDKGGEPSGIEVNEESNMADEMQAPAWADALIKRLDELCSRMDALEEGAKPREDGDFDKLEKKVEGEGYSKEAANKIAGAIGQKKYGAKEMSEKSVEGKKEKEEARKDDDREERDKRHEREGMEREERDKREDRKDENKLEREGERESDRIRKEEDSTKRADAMSAEHIAKLQNEIKAMSETISRLTKLPSSDEREAIAQAFARADALGQVLGEDMTAALPGESATDYRKRLASKFRKFSPALKDVKLDSLDEVSFGIIEARIYDDATAAAKSPETTSSGRLYPIVSDEMGHKVTRYAGDMRAWMQQFEAPPTTATIDRARFSGKEHA